MWPHTKQNFALRISFCSSAQSSSSSVYAHSCAGDICVYIDIYFLLLYLTCQAAAAGLRRTSPSGASDAAEPCAHTDVSTISETTESASSSRLGSCANKQTHTQTSTYAEHLAFRRGTRRRARHAALVSTHEEQAPATGLRAGAQRVTVRLYSGHAVPAYHPFQLTARSPVPPVPTLVRSHIRPIPTYRPFPLTARSHFGPFPLTDRSH